MMITPKLSPTDDVDERRGKRSSEVRALDHRKRLMTSLRSLRITIAFQVGERREFYSQRTDLQVSRFLRRLPVSVLLLAFVRVDDGIVRLLHLLDDVQTLLVDGAAVLVVRG